MKKVYIETLGCQMNKSDSERILGILSHFGYEKTENFKEADLLIINTCNIRELSRNKAYSILGAWGKMKKSSPNIKIAICGCVAQIDKEIIFKRASYVDLVFGTHNIYNLPNLIKRIENGERVLSVSEEAVKNDSKFKIIRAKSFNAWIPIIEGCNNFCTYCIVPYTRGRERSTAMQTIIDEAKTCVSEGFKEITLLGQNVDSYGKDFKDGGKTTLANLLRELNKIEGDFRIRFVTSYPTDITDDLLDAVEQCEKVCKYFHIPMQSGSSEILKKMNRRYNREEYFSIAKKIRSRFEKDNVTITSDFIVGFPSETEDQFLETLSAIDELELDYSNTASYSPRNLTVAARWEDKFIDDATKQKRLFVLNEKNKEAVRKSNRKMLGKVLKVLVENYEEKEGKIILQARAENNKIVHFEGEKKHLGSFLEVEINDFSTWCLFGKSFVKADVK